jgi:cyanophycinase-like exopeptidase
MSRLLEYLNAKKCVDILHNKGEKQADPEVLARLQAADIVMFTGGDQLRLSSILEGPRFMICYWINTIMKNLFMQVLRLEQRTQ